jgi:hypothetical protein
MCRLGRPDRRRGERSGSRGSTDAALTAGPQDNGIAASWISGWHSTHGSTALKSLAIAHPITGAQPASRQRPLHFLAPAAPGQTGSAPPPRGLPDKARGNVPPDAFVLFWQTIQTCNLPIAAILAQSIHGMIVPGRPKGVKRRADGGPTVNLRSRKTDRRTHFSRSELIRRKLSPRRDRPRRSVHDLMIDPADELIS